MICTPNLVRHPLACNGSTVITELMLLLLFRSCSAMLCVEYQTAHELLETTYLKVYFFFMLESPLNRHSSCKSCASISLRDPSRTDVKLTPSPHTPLAMIKQTIQARCWKCQKNTDTYCRLLRLSSSPFPFSARAPCELSPLIPTRFWC